MVEARCAVTALQSSPILVLLGGFDLLLTLVAEGIDYFEDFVTSENMQRHFELIADFPWFPPVGVEQSSSYGVQPIA